MVELYKIENKIINYAVIDQLNTSAPHCPKRHKMTNENAEYYPGDIIDTPTGLVVMGRSYYGYRVGPMGRALIKAAMANGQKNIGPGVMDFGYLVDVDMRQPGTKHTGIRACQYNVGDVNVVMRVIAVRPVFEKVELSHTRAILVVEYELQSLDALSSVVTCYEYH